MEFEDEILKEFKTPLQSVKKRRYHDTPSVLTTDPSALEDLLGCMSSDVPESPFMLPNVENSLLDKESSLGAVKARDSAGNVFYFSKRNVSVKNVNTGRKGRLIQENVHILLNTLEGEKLKEKVQQVQKSNRIQDGELWVDKYKPTKYIELSGNQQVNKAVLDWVKGWDYCVFKKKRRDKKSNDALQRPQNKILLLTGPPGLGKTTMAHVIANHAGYNVIEVNASDDRTGEALKNKLVGAIEVKESMKNNKPNLVIIDEIDGASMSGNGDQNFMKFLLDRVQENETGT
jgi:chromosomal replication initiation ATPase DnaA